MQWYLFWSWKLVDNLHPSLTISRNLKNEQHPEAPVKYKEFPEEKFIYMTRPIVIQIEQFFLKKYSAVYGEYKEISKFV